MSVTSPATGGRARQIEVVELDEFVVRFAGDSGDGMQLAGTQLTHTAAVFGNDVSTFPDFPAEIRAPAGTVAGVSGFQLSFGSHKVRTPGDRVNALIAMNPAALKVNVADLEPGGVLVVNDNAFNKTNLTKAGYDANPLDTDEQLQKYRLFRVPIDTLTAEACKDTGLTSRAVGRCRNFFALGICYWLFERSPDTTLKWIETKFGALPAVAEANALALKAGYHFGDTTEMFPVRYSVHKAKLAPGRYRRISGNEAVAIALATAAKLADMPLFLGTYPITPASEILHELSRLKNYNIRTFQAEDEIAGVTSAIGAAFAGALAVTTTSGPGLALKGEGIGLAVMTELPLVIINVQRAGPSTGLPTKTEQSDLSQAPYGRHGESPVCVLAAATPADCFDVTLEAVRIALDFMTPVIVLSDGYLAFGAEPWRLPDAGSLPKIRIRHPKAGEAFDPYSRDDKLARPWAIPGTAGLEHRIGGLEKKDVSGEICYEPLNHERMIRLRRQKIDNIADTYPPLEVMGADRGELLVVSWGSTYGAVTTALERCQAKGLSVSGLHLRHLEPLPKDLGDVMRRFRKVLLPEMNMGQLRSRLRSEYLIDVIGYSKLQGKPFFISEIEAKISSFFDGNAL